MGKKKTAETYLFETANPISSSLWQALLLNLLMKIFQEFPNIGLCALNLGIIF